MKKNLTKAERLKRKSDFDRVSSKGKRVSINGARLIHLGNTYDYNRFAVCPVKNFGNAVERNRAKRLCREIFRNIKNRIEPGKDIIMVIKPGRYSFADRERQFVELCRKAAITHVCSDTSYCRQKHGSL